MENVVLLVPLGQDLGWFSAKCKATGMRISTKSKLDQKKQAVRESCLMPQVEEFKYHGFLFTSGGRGGSILTDPGFQPWTCGTGSGVVQLQVPPCVYAPLDPLDQGKDCR